jgi:hypothetical protein
LIRTTSASSPSNPTSGVNASSSSGAAGGGAAGGVFSPGSVGSGRTSGSEPEDTSQFEDTSQYECDSEGTSATSNSELSFERRDLAKAVTESAASVMQGENLITIIAYRSVEFEGCFRTAVSLVLDHFYKNRDGSAFSCREAKE